MKLPIKDAWKKGAHLTSEKYAQLYSESLADPEAFWAKVADRVDWIKPFTRVKNCTFNGDVRIRWFEDGELNVSENCIDRHLPLRGEQVAILWEPDEPSEAPRKITYRELHDEVCRFANVLHLKGVRKGDRVTIYMPMIPEAAFAMLACTRLGAIHSVVFGGFSPDSIADRIQDCQSEFVISTEWGRRGGKKIPLGEFMREALKKCPEVKEVFWVGSPEFEKERHSAHTHFVPEKMNAEDPLFILYTSGSTNKPKGVLHTTGGYLVYASYTHEMVFDYRPGEVYWCTADVGWVTGHSYGLYGPLCNGATTLMFEGVPTYPTASRFWEVIDRHSVQIFYTAPTALRSLMREGDGPVRKTSRKSLRVLGSVGEPINPEAWLWYYRVVGEERCPIVDTWWQTETGGILISPLPGAISPKPGSATLPFFGIQPVIVDAEGKVLEGECEGGLCLVESWPGQMRTVYRDHSRFIQTYFSTYPGKYFTGDGCKRDADGYYWITGRVDDVLNVAGHRLGTAEIESALVAHSAVAESAVVGFPHEIKGQGIYAYVTLKTGNVGSDLLAKELTQWVRTKMGPIVHLDFIQWAPGLPKTRSGKIMRRILRKIAENQYESLGDTSTLADPGVVQDLIANRKNH